MSERERRRTLPPIVLTDVSHKDSLSRAMYYSVSVCVRMCVCMCVCIACVSACACACDTMTCVWPSCGGREYVRRDGRCSTLIREQTYERAFKRISSARGLLERERERKNYPTSKHSRPDYRSNRSRIRSIRSPV